MFRIVPILLLLSLSLQTPAEGEEGDAAGLPATQYIYFEPAFVINYGSTGRIKFLRTEIALKVSGAEAAGKVTQHKPYLRHTLVMTLSAQEANVMTSAQGRESLRKLVLDEVKRTMHKLEGMTYVEDLFFNTFVVQS